MGQEESPTESQRVFERVSRRYAATLHKCMSKKSKALMFLALKYEGGEN